MRRTVALAALTLTLGACTPGQSVLFWFGDSDQLWGQARQVVHCESTWNPDVTGQAGERGLWQIHPVHRHTFEQVTGQPWSQAYDPFWNSRFARWLYDTQGWRPWTCRP